MNKYIALLRGINVGGKNKISMDFLKLSFEEIGLSDVISYINSGNIIFSSNEQDINKLRKNCESIIKQKFMLNIPVVIISKKDISEIIKNQPTWWDKDKESINYIIFVIPPTTTENIIEAIGEANHEYEKVESYNNVIFWTAPRKTFSKTKWSKIASSSVNNSVTIRNANTVNKLLALTN